MSVENGIQVVKRPDVKPRAEYGTVLNALRETAESGKAIRMKYRIGGQLRILKAEGFRVRQMRDGAYFIAWAEKVKK